MDTSKTYGVLGKFVLGWVLMPVMNVTHLLLVSSGHKMVSDVKILILVDIGCLLLAISTVSRKDECGIGCTYFMVEEVNVVKMKLSGYGWTRISDSSF